MKVYQVLVKDRLFWVLPFDEPNIRVMVAVSERSKSLTRIMYDYELTKVMTLVEFMAQTTQDPVLAQVPAWDPFWEELEC